MVKTLQPIGNSLGLIIDKPILALLGIDASTQLELKISEDGKGLVIQPLESGERADHKALVHSAAKRGLETHRETLKRLAE